VGYLNAARPPVVPTRFTGRSYPVIARLVLPDGGEEWWPAVAVKWTDTHVLVSTQPGQDRVYTWLEADDVARVIRRPPLAAAAAAAAADPVPVAAEDGGVSTGSRRSG
jgi:hypothetical protein